MQRPRLTYANVTATMALVLAAGGGAIAVAAGPDIQTCVKKSTTANPGQIRVVDAGTTCTANENPLSWPSTLDTPSDVLAKIEQVDGQGSGLDASLLDGIDSTGFLRVTGKATDADKLDGVDSTGFARRGPVGNGTIALGSFAATSCADLTFNIGGLVPNDSVVLSIVPGDALPTRLTMEPLTVPSNGHLLVRICNPTSAASVADNSIKVRWYTLR